MTITKDSSSIHKLRSCLPTQVSSAILQLDKTTLDKICEIRLRREGITTVTIGGQNFVLSLTGLTDDTSRAVICQKQDIDDFLFKFCKGSVFSYETTIKEGFIVSDGIRAGMGSLSSQASGMEFDISSINIRIPRYVKGCADGIFTHICKNGFEDGKGILIISKPGVGKTTLLRDLAVSLSTGTAFGLKRVCVIDERNEIYMQKVFEHCCIDFISGIDKCRGIERASRLLSPEIIICDEISGSEEAKRITTQKNSGVIFIASYHADSYESALKKPYILDMFNNGVFSHIYTLIREGSDIKGSLYRYANN